MKTRDFRTVSMKFTQLVISYGLTACVIFLAIPTNIIGGNLIREDDLEEPVGRIFLNAEIDQKTGKISADNNAEARGDPLENTADKITVTTTSGSIVNYDVLNIEFKNTLSRRHLFSDSKQSRLKGAFVLTVTDRFADVFITNEDPWKRLLANPNVVRVEYNKTVHVPVPPEATASTLFPQSVPESIVRGGYKGLTGKGVKYGIVDNGIDIWHPDFITYDDAGRPTSRIELFWDPTIPYVPGRGNPASVRFPHGPPIGTVFTKQQITTELRSRAGIISGTDLDGHGTACASIAAGNGNADKMAGGLNRPEVVGVAPEADIIVVRLGQKDLENSYLLNTICEWLDKVANKAPLVISGSFGGHYSGHDGQRVDERELNTRFPLTRVGRAIVFAAGNEGDQPIHSMVNFSGRKKMVSWTAKRKSFVKIYFDSADPHIAMYPSKLTPLDSRMWPRVNRITNQLEVIISVDPGVGKIWFENTSGRATDAHLYFMGSDDGAFSPQYVVQSHLVASPGTMGNAITSGTYIFGLGFHSGGRIIGLSSMCTDADGISMPLEIGWLSCYSSPGPTRNGAVKPEIVAPGEWFSAANAKYDGKTVGTAIPDSTGFYRQMRGTSAAAPYTAGIIALMFQKKPALTLGDVKALLQRNVSKTNLHPRNIGLPDKNWGYGKLDLAAIDRIFAAF